MFFRNYAKPGKGVNKREPEQPRIQIFFEILPRNLWRLVKLSILYLLVALPFFVVTMLAMGLISSQIINILSVHFIEDVSNVTFAKYDLLLRVVLSFWFTMFIGQGPITAGLTYIVREYGNERPCWLVSDFFERIKLNFKQGIILWVLDLFVICGVGSAVLFYMSTSMYVFVIILLCFITIYVLTHIYIYQMMITYNLKLRYIFTNSILIALGKLPQSLLTLACLIFIYIVMPVMVTVYGNNMLFLIVATIDIVLFPALCSFIINFSIYPILKRICG